MLQKIFITSLLILGFLVSITAEERILNYSNKYTINNGLAHNGVTSILEDSRGYIWVATFDGLNKYDGYAFESYRNTMDKDLFKSNRIRTLLEDSKGNVWVGTDEGISIYDYQMQQFNILDIPNDLASVYNRPMVRKIVENTDDKTFVVATENSGVWIFDDNYNFIASYNAPRSIATGNGDIDFYDAIFLGQSNYLFASSRGIILFNIKTKEFTKIFKNQVARIAYSLSKIDSSSLIVTLSRGVGVINYKHSPKGPQFEFKEKVLTDYQFNVSAIDNNSSLWLGSSKKGGIIQVPNVNSIDESKITIHAPIDSYVERLKVSCFGITKNKGCWVGTFNKGMFEFESITNPFFTFTKNRKDKRIPLDDEFTFLSIYDDERFLVVSRTKGLYIYNILKKKFEKLPFNINAEKASIVKAAYKDSRGNLWLAFRGSNEIGRIRPDKPWLQIAADNSTFARDFSMRSIVEDADSNIWIGGTSGIIRIRLNQSNTVKSLERLDKHLFFKDRGAPEVHRLYSDKKNHLIWAGTKTEGIYRINTKGARTLQDVRLDIYKRDVKKPNSLSSNSVTSFIRLENDEFWIGTEGGGICKVLNSTAEPKFLPFTEKSGLSNNVVKNVLADNEHNLWVSTNIGLNKFNPKDKRFRVYGAEEGLPFEDFWYPGFNMANGTLVFGGLQGFVCFNPKELAYQEPLPNVELGDLKLFNKSVMPGDTINGRVLLSERINNLNKITLQHDENVFSIEVRSLHFSNPKTHYVKYKILPINDEWIEVSSDQRNIYSNGLPAGTYTLRIVASNSFNKWTEPRDLEIEILPPFWKTGTAMFLYMIGLVIILLIILRFVQRVSFLKHSVELEQIEKKNASEVNSAKLRFFSNISHEIKTPLTLISGPINLLSEKYKSYPDIFENLNRVQRQSRKISQLIDQVHDFQRSDADLLEMHHTQFSVDMFIDDLTTDFNFLADRDNKNLVINNNQSGLFVWADRDKLEKIINNLLSNAFKYTTAEDTITVDYGVENNELFIKVKDTGRGIDESDLPHIFERFYQSKIKHGAYIGGSGIGLAFSKRLVEMHYGNITAESEVHVGTTITVQLPILKQTDTASISEEKQLLAQEEKLEVKANEISSSVEDLKGLSVSDDLKNSRIFFAEDNTEMRNYVSGILSDFFEVKTFKNGQECIDAMHEEWPDLVLSDVLMPELNGLELCKNIKGDIKTSHIPVILLTACTTIDDQIKGIQEGADAYIQKPFNAQHLLTSIEALLTNRAALRERFKVEIPLKLNKETDNINDTVFLEKLYNIMEENLDNQNVDFNDIARKLYLNRTHFYQKVKAVTNQTPFELIRMYRIKKAAEFFAQGTYSVNEVFMMTGFKSRSHFTKLFKEKYDVTPGKYASEALKRIKE
ncbi:hybrid sensor histidine kinase/response regulator transcription factor [Saccharicrinis aurantiacus]|uniref:hybrid sensor histidine kinase/response regulator transcription factor n=1 Tax=Saccharicrinis aurantiacus TaxID=1849719 RepID=UPI0008387408|nr:two-component regulator propeller domain-containing protein [Saccharicrinis aurantiacus]